MEHMKRMVFVILALVAAGAVLMYVHKNMYKNCGSEDVKVQSMADQESPEDMLRSKMSKGKSAMPG